MAEKESKPNDPGAAEESAKATIKMSEALKRAQTWAEGVEGSFERQLALAIQLRNVIQEMSKGVAEGNAAVGQSNGMLNPDTWDKTTRAVKKATKQTENFKDATQKLSKYLKSDFEIACDAASAAVQGLGQGFRNFFALLKGASGLIESAVGAIFDLGKAIISIPLRIISGLFEMAKGAGDTSLAVAIEDVRKQFGALTSESSRTVLTVAKNMGKLDSTGVSAYSLFGNVAERVKAVNAMATAMGSTFQVFQGEIEKNGEAIMRYNKGLGITDEQLGNIGYQAMRMGKDISEVQNEMAKQALGMEKAFGKSAKVISKDMAKAMADLAHFGHLSTKELAVAATFANKLGVSVDKLTSIMDATKTYDNTAEQVSRLNEQFNLNIDSQELFAEQDGAKQIAILQREFQRAGIDVSKMNRYQRELIKSTGFMGDELLNASLSAKGMSVNLDQIQRAGDKNEKKTMSQTEALTKLSDSMERIVQQANLAKGGILGQIIEGFGRGIKQSPEFIKLMTNMNAVLQKSLMFGVRLGRMFVDLFPGVKDIIGGMAELFDPSRWQKMYDKVLKVFEKFFKGGAVNFEDFMKELKDIFFDFFNNQTPAGKKTIEGFKTFGSVLLKLFGTISKNIIDKLADVISGIADWITNPKMPKEAKGLTGALTNPFAAALNSLESKLMPALEKLAKSISTKLFEAFKKFVYPHLPIIGAVAAGIIFGPAFMGALGSIASQVIGRTLSRVVTEKMLKMGPEIQSASEKIQAAGGRARSKKGVLPHPKAMAEDAASAKVAEQVKVNWHKVAQFLVGLAGVILIGLGAYWAALQIVKGEDPQDIMSATLVFGAVVSSMVIFAAFGKIMSTIDKFDWKKAGLAIASVAAMMVVGIGLFGKAVHVVKSQKAEPRDVLVAGALMQVMAVALLEAAGLAFVASKIGGIIKSEMSHAVIGLVAMGLIVLSMIGLGALMIKATKGVDAAKISAGATMLTAVGASFLIAGAAIFVAIGVGAAVLAGSGIGGGLALVGLAAMSLVIGAMAVLTYQIIKELSGIPGDANALKLKAEAFASIMGVIAQIGNSIANILKALDFGFFESSQEKVAKINSLKDLIEVLLNGKDGKGGIKGIVDSVVDGLKVISPEKAESAKAFGSVLTAVSTMIGTIGTGLIQLQKASVSGFGIYVTEKDQQNFPKLIGTLGTYIEAITKPLLGQDGFISKITSAATALPSDFKDKGSVLADLLGSVGSLLQALMPNLEQFQNKSEFGVSGGGLIGSMLPSLSKKSANINTKAIETVQTYITKIMDSMAANLPKLFTGISDAVKSLSGLSKDQLAAVPVIGEIFKSVALVVSALAGSMKSAPKVDIKDSKDAVVIITNQLPDFSKMLKDISNNLPDLLKTIINVTSTVPVDKTFKERLENVKTIFEIISAIPKLMNELSSVTSKDGAKGSIDEWGLTKMLAGVATFMNRIFVWRWFGDDPPMQQIVNALNSPAAKSIAGIKSQIESIKSLFETIATIPKAISEFDNAISAAGITKDQHAEFHLASKILPIGTFLSRIFSWKWEKKFGGDDRIPADMISEAMSSPSVDRLVKIKDKLEPLKTAFSGLISLVKEGIMPLANIENFNEWEIAKKLANVAILFARLSNRGWPWHPWDVPLLEGLVQELENTVSLSPRLNVASSKLKAVGMAKSLDAISEIVKAYQTINDALDPKDGKVIDVQSRIKALADSVGLGGRFNYTVENKDVVIHLNLGIVVEADEMEKAIVYRKESIIRDRINFLLGGGSGADKKPPEGRAFVMNNQNPVLIGKNAGS